MKTISLTTLIDSALQQMERNEAPAHMLKNYRETGFGVFRRHFRSHKQTEYSAEVIDEIVAKTRSEYENGTISYRKWKIVHRGGELLKLWHLSGSLDLPPCERWDVTHNKLHCEPTPEELSDLNNIFSLVWRTKLALSKSNLSAKTQSNYQYDGFDRVLKIHIKYGLEHYSPVLLVELLEQSRQNCKNGKMNKSVFNSLHRVTELLREFIETGELRSITLPNAMQSTKGISPPSSWQMSPICNMSGKWRFVMEIAFGSISLAHTALIPKNDAA